MLSLQEFMEIVHSNAATDCWSQIVLSRKIIPFDTFPLNVFNSQFHFHRITTQMQSSCFLNFASSAGFMTFSGHDILTEYSNH